MAVAEFSPPAPNDKCFKITVRANELFERHQYREAAQEYSKAIQQCHAAQQVSNEFLALLHSNRSASFLLARQALAARDDASLVMKLLPSWSKVKGVYYGSGGGFSL